jgi:restriction system protein
MACANEQIREMYGLLMHHQATAVKIVALGNYTSDAHRFAQGKPIELIPGGELIATVRSLQATKARSTGLLDSLLAFSGGMVASLLVIGVLSSATTTTPSPAILSHVASQPASQRTPALVHRQPSCSRQRFTQAKRNAESMKILEKTTKKMPLR